MSVGLLMKLLHVLSAFWFIGGILARDIAFWRAARSESVPAVYSLLAMSDFFERWAVISGGLVVTLFGILAAWRNGWPLLGFLQGAASNWLLVSFVLFVGGSFVVVPLRLVARRRQREKAVEAAMAKGEITPELRAALNDKVVNGFRKVELVVLVFIIILMVTKPF